jgi:hypothetical protein
VTLRVDAGTNFGARIHFFTALFLAADHRRAQARTDIGAAGTTLFVYSKWRPLPVGTGGGTSSGAIAAYRCQGEVVLAGDVRYFAKNRPRVLGRST